MQKTLTLYAVNLPESLKNEIKKMIPREIEIIVTSLNELKNLSSENFFLIGDTSQVDCSYLGPWTYFFSNTQDNDEIHSINNLREKKLFLKNLEAILECYFHYLELKDGVLALESKINKSFISLDSNLQKIKRTHKKLVPIKTHKWKGVLLQSKYRAGELGKNEYFEIIEIQHQIIIAGFQFSSYFEQLQISDFIVNLRNEGDASKAFSTLQKFSQENLKNPCYFIWQINPTSLKTHLESTGHFLIHKLSERKLIPNSEFSLEKGSDYVILSPGIQLEWLKANNYLSMSEFIQKKITNSDTLVLNELFSELVKNDSDNYDNDILAFILEVSEYAITTA